MSQNQTLINMLRVILTQSDDESFKYVINKVLSLEREISIVYLALTDISEKLGNIKNGLVLMHNDTFVDDNVEDI